MDGLSGLIITICLGIIVALPSAASDSRNETCTTKIYLDSGPVCTSRRLSNDDGVEFVSFRGIPYAKQPLGRLRFKELQPVDPWTTTLDASENGPICPQTDYFYETIFGAKNSSEACIYANIHVPVSAMSFANKPAPQLLPILVFVHGGGFAFGSGDNDLHGPEYLMSKGVILVTFNYRLNVFGFLSLNSTYIPGNNGIRDVVTLLRWVQRNAHTFGGDPDDVTIAGQSAGAVIVSYLQLSSAVRGHELFKRVIAMSGAAVRTFCTTTPAYSKIMANYFLGALNITSKDPEEVHQQLVDMPLEKIMAAHEMMLNTFGFIVFSPVVECPLQNVTAVLDDLPENLINQGRGSDIPILMGFTSNEGETFRDRVEQLSFTTVIKATIAPLVPLDISYSRPEDVSLKVASVIKQRYFNDTVDYDRIVTWLTEMVFQNSALKTADLISGQRGVAFLYEFDYVPDFNILRIQKNYPGAAHVEDMTYIFKIHAALVDESKYSKRDRQMRDWMTSMVVNFMKCSNPICKETSSSWPAVDRRALKVQYIDTPGRYQVHDIGKHLTDLLQFADYVYTL